MISYEKTIFLFFGIAILLSVISCGKNEDSGMPGFKERKITVKVAGSDNLLIENVVVVTVDNNGSASTHTFDDLNVKSWSKDFVFTGVISAAVSATTANEQSGTMNAQLIENGKVIKESKSEGKFLSATVSSGM